MSILHCWGACTMRAKKARFEVDLARPALGRRGINLEPCLFGHQSTLHPNLFAQFARFLRFARSRLDSAL